MTDLSSISALRIQLQVFGLTLLSNQVENKMCLIGLEVAIIMTSAAAADVITTYLDLKYISDLQGM